MFAFFGPTKWGYSHIYIYIFRERERWKQRNACENGPQLGGRRNSEHSPTLRPSFWGPRSHPNRCLANGRCGCLCLSNWFSILIFSLDDPFWCLVSPKLRQNSDKNSDKIQTKIQTNIQTNIQTCLNSKNSKFGKLKVLTIFRQENSDKIQTEIQTKFRQKFRQEFRQRFGQDSDRN